MGDRLMMTLTMRTTAVVLRLSMVMRVGGRGYDSPRRVGPSSGRRRQVLRRGIGTAQEERGPGQLLCIKNQALSLVSRVFSTPNCHISE